jgi:uncharacterized protein (DUF885 family)
MKRFMRKGCAVAVVVIVAALAGACSERGASRAASSSGGSSRVDDGHDDRSNSGSTHSNHGSNSGEGASARLPPPAAVDALVRENLEAELQEAPVAATWLGVHAYDDRIDDVRPEAQARQANRLRLLLERLRAIDEGALDPPHAFDRLLLIHRADAALYTLTELRPLERNPLVYCDLAQSAIFELVRDDFLPATDRLRTINARLWKLRQFFEDARRNLRPTASELAVRRAVDELQSARGFIAETLPRAMQGVPDPKPLEELRQASGDAARALDDFANWLNHDLLPRAHGELALGREHLMELLRRGEGVDVTPELLVALGERELKEARKRYDEAARAISGGRAGVDVGKALEEDHGKPEELLTSAQQTLELAVAFARDEALLTLPLPQRPKVIEMPPALWGYMQLSMAGPLEQRPHDAFLYVDPIEKGWPDKERGKLEHLRTFNRPIMVRTILHDAVGHYAQAELNRRAPTTMQKIALSPLFVEGWADYVEDMMLAEGFLAGDAKARLAVARATMLRAARLVAAVRLHALGAKLDDVAKVFTDEAGLDEYQARREAERAAVDPMVLGDALGRIAISKLRDDWRAAHPAATLGAFHDALLRHGTPSPILLRRVLLPGADASPL